MLVTVTVCGELADPTSWLPNVKLVGLTDTAGAAVVPVPLTATTCELGEALSVMARFTGPLEPEALGVNVMLIMQLPPGATLAPFVQVVVLAIANSLVAGLKEGVAVMLRAALPVFSTVTLCAGLVVPTNCPANVSVVGPGVSAPNRPSCSPLMPAVK